MKNVTNGNYLGEAGKGAETEITAWTASQGCTAASFLSELASWGTHTSTFVHLTAKPPFTETVGSSPTRPFPILFKLQLNTVVSSSVMAFELRK